MIPVILESPYSGDVERNKRYARACMRDCISRGESPYASHMLLTQPGVLDDNNPEERELGINAGFTWRCVAQKTVVYIDLGISNGMKSGIDHAMLMGHLVEYRSVLKCAACNATGVAECAKCDENGNVDWENLSTGPCVFCDGTGNA